MPKKIDKKRKAVGKKMRGNRIVHPVDQANPGYTYQICCEDCGDVMGCVTFDTERRDFDPADSGLICGDCTADRTEE